MNRDEVIEGVRECVADVVSIDVGTVGVNDRIITDLGADSLDLLDLVFQLEQRFKVRISPRGIERRAQAELDGTPMEIDGIYTKEALGQLRRALPEVPEEELAEGLHTSELPRLFRVMTFVCLVERMLEEQHA